MTIYLILQIVVFIFDEIQKSKVDRGIFIELFISKDFSLMKLKFFIFHSALISIVYLITFIIVLTRYFPNGIWTVNFFFRLCRFYFFFQFAWLTLIQLIGGSVLFILAIMGLIVSLSLIHRVGVDIIVDIIFTIIGNSIIVLSVNICLLCF
jgi:hypothetical protein